MDFPFTKNTPFICQNAFAEPDLELNLEPASATVVTSEHHEVTGGYKGLQGVTRGYRGLQGVTRGDRG